MDFLPDGGQRGPLEGGHQRHPRRSRAQSAVARRMAERAFACFVQGAPPNDVAKSGRRLSAQTSLSQSRPPKPDRSTQAARIDLLIDVRRSINAAIGRAVIAPINAGALEALRLPSHAWLRGKPLNEIERMLGGNPDGSAGARMLPRAREFVGTVILRSFSVVLGVVARMAEELSIANQQLDISTDVLQSLSACVRRGFDTSAKLEYANADRTLIGRVEVHRAYAQMIASMFDDLDDLT